MSAPVQNPKEKYDALLKEIRIQKSLSVLEKIYEDLKANKSSLYDNNKVPFQFSNDLIWLLQYHFIKSETQLDIFKLYIDEFFTMKCKPEDIGKIGFLYEIFNYDTNFYRAASNIENFLVFLNRFFNIYYPKNATIKHEVGDAMDVLVADEVFKISLLGWIQMPIKRIDNEKKLYIFDDYKDNNKEIMISIDSFKVQEKNTFVKEEEMTWRNNLKEGDKVDYFNSNLNWTEGYVKEVNSNGDISIKAINEKEENIIFLKRYSPFIQPLLKHSFKYTSEEANALNKLGKNNDFNKFKYLLPVTENNYLIPQEDIIFYSLEYYEILNYFINKMISSKILEKESLPIEYYYLILNIIISCKKIINQKFIGKYFFEKVYENLQKSLLNYSLDKKKNISKIFIEKIINYIDELILFSHYTFQLIDNLVEINLNLGYNCFKTSESLEKRLLGLTIISKILEIYNMSFSILGKKTIDEITSIINDKLLNNSQDNDFFGLLFITPNVHEQLIMKGMEIIYSLSKIKILDGKHIVRLYDITLSKPIDSEMYTSLYRLLNNVTEILSLDQCKVIFNKIISFPYDKLTVNDIQIMGNVLNNLNSKDDFRTMTKTFLDYFYTFIVDFKKKDIEYAKYFGEFISNAKDEDNFNYLYIYYFEKFVNELNNQNDLEGYRFFYSLIHSLFDSLLFVKKIDDLKNKFKEIFFKNNNFETIVDKLLLLNSKDEKDINEEYINDVFNVVNGLATFLEQKNFYTIDGMLKLSDFFVFGNKTKKRNEFLYTILNLKEDEIDKNELYDKLFKKIDEFFDTITPERRYLLDDDLITVIYSLYVNMNKLPELEKNNYESEYKNYINKLKAKINPLENKYFNVIWKMFLKFSFTKKSYEFLDNFSLKNFSPSERHEIWETFVKKIFTDIDSKDTNDNIKYICLKMLEYLLKISEKYGNGNAISHIAETKKKNLITLELVNYFSNSLNNYPPEKTYEIFSTSTIYDVKKYISKKYGIDPIFFDLSSNVIKENIIDLTSKPLFLLFPKLLEFSKEKCSLTIKRSLELTSCIDYPLNNEDDLTEKFLDVLKEIYFRFAKDEKLDINNYKIFFNNAMGHDMKNTVMEKQACESFHKYDKENKGYWSIHDFILFHANAIFDKKKNSIYTNLLNLGYTRSLVYYLEPIKKDCPLYYEENNVKEYMPRYFVGNNTDYMGKLFVLAKNKDKKISELAQNLLKELSTLEQMKNTIFNNDKKIDDILSSPNLELRAYAYDILLTEFEKSNDINNDDSENTKNNFINNNLYKLIIELDKFNKNNQKNETENEINTNQDKIEEKKEEEKKEEEKNKENKTLKELQTSQFFNYYLSNLKIFYYAFKYIVKIPELIEYIDKFEDLDEENEKNKTKNIKIVLDEEKKNLIKKLDLLKLVNIIGDNFELFEKNGQLKQREGIRLSVKILIYIILISKNLPVEEKSKIYKSYFGYQIKLTQTSSFFIKRNLFIMNKLILPFMDEESDKIFVQLENEEMSKEILDYKKLNGLSGKLMFFFKSFNDLYDLSIKDTKNDEIFKIFENLLKIILDKNIELNEYLLIGYLSIIKSILTTLKNSKYSKIIEYDFCSLVPVLIDNFLITFEKDENNKIIEVKKQKKYSKYSDYEYVSNIFQILDIIISLNPEKYIKLFFENEEIKNVREKHLTKLEESKIEYAPKRESISTAGFVGLRNLSSLCYMNSVIQQFFMMPLFKNAILSLPIDPSLKEEDDNDNLMFQLEKMFYYLKNSQKEHYNPKSFVFSFKDYEGNPTNINIQCDAQEFLSRLIEKIDEGLKNNFEKYLCYNIFGGTTLQQVKCTNPECGNISERKENINYLSLDIKNCKDIQECLDKFIADEKIEDYHCEKCDKKTTNIKNVLIDKVPNILIIHLQRIAFSYETFNMEKMNRYISFEKTLNIKNYTLNKNNNDVPSDYFDYELIGVLIHSGTAQYGHYYSIIYSEEKDSFGKWYKFNDTSVTEINYDMMITDAYGSETHSDYGSSAYMLIYQKKEKKPVIINCKEISENIKKILDENKEKNLDEIVLPEGKIYYAYENEKDAVEKNIIFNKEENKNNNINKDIVLKNAEVEAKLVTYEEALDLLIKKNNDPNEKKPFINKILIENIKLCNDKKFFTKGFTKFMYQISEHLKKEILEDKTNTKIDTYIPILKTINDYILNILAISNYKDELNLIITNITDIYNHSANKDLLSYLIKDVIEPIKEKLYIDYLVSRDRIMGNDIGNYIAKIICCGLNNNIENEISLKIIEFYVDKIPVEITKKWIDMESFNNLILAFIENSDIIKKMFIHNGMITKLIDFILGRSSPFYQGDDRVENKNNKGRFGPIVKSIGLLFKYYVENHEKEEIKLFASDIKLINYTQFYEKVVLEDYDNNACNILIDNKMQLSLILNKEESNKDFDKEILDILIKLKIPSIKKKEEINSCLKLINNLIKKYSDLYLNKEENDENKDLFTEKLNILLGLPIPDVTSGEAEIKFISGKYQDKFTILTNISKIKEIKKDLLPLLTSIFNLLNINDKVFEYVDNLPAPNSLKYSYADYFLKLFALTQKETEADFKVNDEMGIENPLKNLSILVDDICKKHNKDINSIRENEKISITDILFFNEFNFKTIKDLKNTDKLNVIEMTITYCTLKSLKKTSLPCFEKKNYFHSLIFRKVENNDLTVDGFEQHTLLCILICCESDLDIKIDFKPYFSSKIEINGKKEFHYYLYCMDYDNKDKNIDYTKMNIEIQENQPLALPNSTDQLGNDNEGCSMNCPVCGVVNILNESNVEFKCVFCQSPLF